MGLGAGENVQVKDPERGSRSSGPQPKSEFEELKEV